MMQTEEHTTDLFIPLVIQRQSCVHHNAEMGEPCYYIWPSNGREPTSGVCNKRARGAGFNAKISPKSLSMFRKAKPDGQNSRA